MGDNVKIKEVYFLVIRSSHKHLVSPTCRLHTNHLTGSVYLSIFGVVQGKI